MGVIKDPATGSTLSLRYYFARRIGQSKEDLGGICGTLGQFVEAVV